MKNYANKIFSLETNSKGDNQDDDSEPKVEDKPTVSQGDTINCPRGRTRRSHYVATFCSCPYVMIVAG